MKPFSSPDHGLISRGMVLSCFSRRTDTSPKSRLTLANSFLFVKEMMKLQTASSSWKWLRFACILWAWQAIPTTLFAQYYGFTPTVVMSPGTTSDWGNAYSGAVMQVPTWSTTATVSPPVMNSWQYFQLGATLQNLSNGVLIRSVVPGGLAAINGLKAGDIVISAGGIQVGYVNGRTVDLVTEMSRRADVYGRISLAVLDSRLQQIRAYDFSLRPTGLMPGLTAGAIGGEVLLDGSVALASYGTLKVELQNATRPYLQIVGGSDTKSVYGRGPFLYNIRFDAQSVYSNDRFRLVATLFDGYQQVIGYGVQEIAAPTPGVQTTYNIRLTSRQTYAFGGQAGMVGYSQESNVFYPLFRQYIGREPTVLEAQAWASQLASGMVPSNEVKAELLASPAFYDRAGNQPDLFVQLMIETASGLPARPDQVQYWRSRLDATNGMRLAVAREYLATVSP